MVSVYWHILRCYLPYTLIITLDLSLCYQVRGQVSICPRSFWPLPDDCTTAHSGNVNNGNNSASPVPSRSNPPWIYHFLGRVMRQLKSTVWVFESLSTDKQPCMVICWRIMNCVQRTEKTSRPRTALLLHAGTAWHHCSFSLLFSVSWLSLCVPAACCSSACGANVFLLSVVISTVFSLAQCPSLFRSGWTWPHL